MISAVLAESFIPEILVITTLGQSLGFQIPVAILQ